MAKPCVKAGLTSDMNVVGVNGKVFSIEVLRAAILQAEKNTTPLKLLVKRGNDLQTVEIDYHGGLRYPSLSRVEGKADLLDDILAPK